jgi:hypothetical protein
LALDGAVTAAGIIVTMMVAIITKAVEATGLGLAIIVADLFSSGRVSMPDLVNHSE